MISSTLPSSHGSVCQPMMFSMMFQFISNSGKNKVEKSLTGQTGISLSSTYITFGAIQGVNLFRLFNPDIHIYEYEYCAILHRAFWNIYRGYTYMIRVVVLWPYVQPFRDDCWVDFKTAWPILVGIPSEHLPWVTSTLCHNCMKKYESLFLLRYLIRISWKFYTFA